MSRQRKGCLWTIFQLLLLCLVVTYGVAGLTSPWAFHIGGRTTPLLYWSGYGKLVTKNGICPLYVILYPSPHFSRLRLDGLRPTGGVKGTGSLCTSAGVVRQLKLSGTIYGGWSSTENSLMEFRLNEFKFIDMGQRQGYFDLFGRWRGQELVMDDRNETSRNFSFGFKVEHASVTLDWGSFADFKAACAASGNPAGK